MSKEVWHQLVIRDPAGLTGLSARDFLYPIIEQSHARWVHVRDVVGAYSGLGGAGGASISASELLNRVTHAVQYDWAFFFLFRDEPSLASLDTNDRGVIAAADVTVRLADNAYFYVYTTDENLAAHLIRTYPDAEHKLERLENLEILY